MSDAQSASRIVFYCNYVTGGWSPENPAALNGSEEAVYQVATAWAQKGHDVFVYQNGFVGTWKGVEYHARGDKLPERVDILVVFKTLDHFDHPARAKLFWSIDLPVEGAVFFPPRLVSELTGILCVSEWHRQHVVNACPWVPPEKIYSHWLGVDPEEIVSVQGVRKIPGRCVYASSLDRGVHPLLDYWPEIKKHVPEAELHVMYGWDFWLRSESVVGQEMRTSMQEERRKIEQKLKQPGVTYVGRPTSRDVYLKEMAEAVVWPYPCTGGELCCKVALEAQALGAVPVVWPTMALKETVFWKSGHILPQVGPQAYIQKVVEALRDPPVDAVKAQARTTVPSWEQLADFAWKIVAPKPVVVETPVSQERKPFVIPRRTRIPKYALDIVFAVPGMPFVGDTDQKSNLGGSETMGLQLARHLHKLGHKVTVFSTFPEGAKPGKFDGVTYMPLNELGKYLGAYYCDAYIVQREPTLLNLPHRARVSTLWCHDLGLLRYHEVVRGSLWNIDYLVPVSHWHGRQLQDVYNLEKCSEFIVPMFNGVDFTLGQTLPKFGAQDKNAVVYAARPERGLDLLLDHVYPRLLERFPKLTLYVAGYDNTADQLKEFYQYCNHRVAEYGARAKWMGYLKKSELYQLYSRSRAYLYPTKGFEEVSPLRGDTLIDTPGGRIPIEQLWKEDRKDFPVYAFNHVTGKMALAKVSWVKRTRRNAKLLTVHFKWGIGCTATRTGSITLTPDHEVMLRDGTYRRADQLQVGDRVMPFNRTPGWGRYKTLKGKTNKYNLISLNDGTRVPEHRFVMEWTLGRPLISKEVVDHLDANPQNNSPENLIIHSGHSEHRRATWNRLSPRQRGKERREKTANLLRWHAKFTPTELSEIKRRACLEGWRQLRSDPVRLAARNQKLSETRRQLFAQENHVITSIEQAPNADVYCMEVPDLHNFVANGIVVHNCLSAMECALNGLPFVASDYGALKETTDRCQGFAKLVPHPGEPTEKYIEDFVEAAAEVIGNDVLNQQMSQAGLFASRAVYSMERVAQEWEDFLLGVIEQRSENIGRLISHHWRIGDTYGAQTLAFSAPVGDAESPNLDLIQTALQKPLVPDSPTPIPHNAGTSIVEAIKSVAPLDFKTVLGVGEKGQELAELVAANLPKGVAVTEAPADLVVAHEILDVSPNPTEKILELEALTTPGGRIALLIGGPSIARHELFQRKVHFAEKGRWVFDHHDLRDLLAKKPELAQFVIGGTTLSGYDESVLSWLLVHWKAGGDTGRINFERRRHIQSPTPTMSVIMLGKNVENLLTRCLKSVQPYVDEIILGNDASEDSTLDICKRFGVKTFDVPSPLEIGFGPARNLTLERAKGDWVFWIDPDEELLDPSKLPKYIRWNPYMGYGIAQHHFSAVPANAFRPDLPVRFFRRVHLDGKDTGIRFHGFVHEHPETAINFSVGESVVMSDVHLAHDGYLTENVRIKRFDRNIRLMLKDRVLNPDRNLGKFLMIRDWVHMARYSLARTGGRLTPEIAEYLEAALKLFQDGFLGSINLMGQDGLTYYNEALNHLKRGYDVSINLKVAGLNGKPQDFNYTGRVASAEDLAKLLSKSCTELTVVWKGKYL